MSPIVADIVSALLGGAAAAEITAYAILLFAYLSLLAVCLSFSASSCCNISIILAFNLLVQQDLRVLAAADRNNNDLLQI